ncbi:Protein of unknown function [Pyronema omphalodes CBS 100304]|uniref:Uncharacterized protein n=1 Tax=Pyronema omphalodes (strain CBS 100304) TaxID=1076935 RepID=U4KZF8_PYROM|nr:Protein of unknown function [Pyronema omphalodes CBS 100304]
MFSPAELMMGIRNTVIRGGFGLRVAFRLHKKTHSGYKGKLEKKDWQGYWTRAQKALKKERPSKRKVFDSVSKCCDTQRLNHIVATYYDHKEAIDNDRTSQEFDKLSKDLHPFGISEITLNGIATAVHYQEGISPVKSMVSLLPVPENTAPPSLSNGSKGYRTSNSGNFYAVSESFYTAPAYPTAHGSIPDLDAPQIPLEEPQGPSTFLPQNQALSHAGGSLDTNLTTPGVLLRCEEAANTMMRILAFSELVDVSQFVDMHDGTCRAIYGILDSIYRPNGQQMPSNGTGTMPHNPQNPQNLHNFEDSAYIAADDVSMVYTTATNGSEQQIQPSNIHTAISMHQHSAILNPLNRQDLQPGRFPNQAGPSSAAEGIQGWAEDANDLHQRLYERGLSRENGYHDHTESGG